MESSLGKTLLHVLQIWRAFTPTYMKSHYQQLPKKIRTFLQSNGLQKLKDGTVRCC